MFPGLPCHISLNGYNSSSHSPPHAGSLMLGQEGLLPPGIKSPSTPLNSPTRGQLFLSDHQSENSNDPAVTSDQEDEDENLRLDPRIDITEHRGDPRDDLRAAEDREPDSPTAPLSLTTNDKGSTGTSPKHSNLPEVNFCKTYLFFMSRSLWRWLANCFHGNSVGSKVKQCRNRLMDV